MPCTAGAMVFKPRKFFLTFDKEASQTPVSVAPVIEKPLDEELQGAGQVGADPVTRSVWKASTTTSPEAASSEVLTTAEAIAAELRAAQANRPAPSLATFAPDNLTPGNGLPMRRRTAGANLAFYREVAAGMFKS